MAVGQLVPSNLFLNHSAATTLIPTSTPPRHRHLLCISSANHTTATDNDSPFSSFGRVKTLLVHRRRKDQSHRRAVQLEDDNDDDIAPRPRRSQSRSRGGERWDMIPNYTPQSKSATDTKFFSLKSFKEIGCSEYMIESLQKLLLSRPSHVQAMAFAPVISGKTCVIADQSGSGKTLAYLAPIIQLLRLEELEGRSSKSSSQAPRVLVLAPTAELASQVLDNCRSLSKSGVPFKSMVVTGGFRQKTQLENLQQGVDVLIATPGRFLFLIHEGFLQLTNLRW